jgi:hypothetical protein
MYGVKLPTLSYQKRSKKLTPSQWFWLAPIRLTLTAGVVLNWFVFFYVSASIGGDAIGTTPSTQGFVVTEHGLRTHVTAPIWLFSLFYSLATLLLSPLLFVLLIASFAPRRTRRSPYALMILLFMPWYGLWSYALLRDGSHSLLDYLHLQAMWSPFCWIVLLSIILLTIGLFVYAIPRRGRCARCGCELRASPERCTACGTVAETFARISS